ncbi:hypothetical protein MUO79_01050 [Candidatus Bathyarchaeota archaeon]|nr:hypothetical protein [Candidatus Bathyarchaeota archaeon]
MIKLTSVSSTGGDTTLAFSFDNVGQTFTVQISLLDILDRLRVVKKVLGRPLALADAKLVIIQIVNELRAGSMPLMERFDFGPFIGIDLEGTG